MKAKGVANSSARPTGGAYRQKIFKLDSEKFRELIVYIVRRNRQTDPTFGAIKLNKVLYYADFAAYRHFGSRSPAPLTGNLLKVPPRSNCPMCGES